MNKRKGKNNYNYRHGGCCGEKTKLYHTWQRMRQRCLNPRQPKYHRYGGRGITITKKWDCYSSFEAWALKNGYQDGLTLDRVNNDGNYTPKNCRWVSMSENSRKKGTTKISFQDAIKIRERLVKGESESDLATEFQVVHGTIWFIARGYTHVAEGECSKKLKERDLKK
jgi:hypothetical protein